MKAVTSLFSFSCQLFANENMASLSSLLLSSRFFLFVYVVNEKEWWLKKFEIRSLRPETKVNI